MSKDNMKQAWQAIAEKAAFLAVLEAYMAEEKGNDAKNIAAALAWSEVAVWAHSKVKVLEEE